MSGQHLVPSDWSSGCVCGDVCCTGPLGGCLDAWHRRQLQIFHRQDGPGAAVSSHPLEIRKRIKVFIDLLVDRWFRGVAGGVLWILTTQLQFSVRWLSLVVIFLAAIWTGLAVVVGREIDPDELRMEITDTSMVEPLLSVLASEHERQVTYALDMLVSVKNADLVLSMRPLMKHRSAEVRRKSLQVFQRQADQSLLSDAEELLGDPD